MNARTAPSPNVSATIVRHPPVRIARATRRDAGRREEGDAIAAGRDRLAVLVRLAHELDRVGLREPLRRAGAARHAHGVEEDR